MPKNLISRVRVVKTQISKESLNPYDTSINKSDKEFANLDVKPLLVNNSGMESIEEIDKGKEIINLEEEKEETINSEDEDFFSNMLAENNIDLTNSMESKSSKEQLLKETKSKILQRRNEENIKYLADNIKFEGPSPDEISLLTGCKDICKFFFTGADSKRVVIQTPNQKFEVEKLITNEFESDRKMMSVLVRHNGKLILMCKGADNSILSRLNKNVYEMQQHNSLISMKEIILKRSKRHSLTGYRGLLMAIRVLSESEVKTFKKRYTKICQMSFKEKKIAYKVFLKDLETDLILIGSSAVEDKLQDGLRNSIRSMRRAQMQIWVLTGDKMETAENIAVSSDLFKQVFYTF